MSTDLIIIDGYNVIHKIPALVSVMDKSLEGARRALADLILSWKSRSRYSGKFCVVFDVRGQGSIGDAYFDALGIKCIYANDADGQIIQLLKDNCRSRRIVVVSADNRVRNHCKAYMAGIHDPNFLVRKEAVKSHAGFEKEIDEETIDNINNDLKKAWGI
jgi:predicted RNA-binding protein with PIN domain